MKRFYFAFASLLLLIHVSPAQAEAEPNLQGSVEGFLPAVDKHPYSEIFTLNAGALDLPKLQVSNSHADFQYSGNASKTAVIEPGIAIKLFHFLGSFYLQENLPIFVLNNSLPAGAGDLRLFAMGVDTRLRYAWEWFPLKAVIPFFEGGYRATVYSQSGPSDFENTQGLAGNFVAAAGMDIWINAMFSPGQNKVDRYDSTPIFLTAKVNRIFSNHSSFDVASTSVLFGVGVGL